MEDEARDNQLVTTLISVVRKLGWKAGDHIEVGIADVEEGGMTHEGIFLKNNTHIRSLVENKKSTPLGEIE